MSESTLCRSVLSSAFVSQMGLPSFLYPRTLSVDSLTSSHTAIATHHGALPPPYTIPLPIFIPFSQNVMYEREREKKN